MQGVGDKGEVYNIKHNVQGIESMVVGFFSVTVFQGLMVHFYLSQQ